MIWTCQHREYLRGLRVLLAREARQPTWMPTSPPGRYEDLHREAAIAQTEVGLLMRSKTRATLNQDDPGVPAALPYINIINQQAKIVLKAASELGFAPRLPAAGVWRPISSRTE